MQLLSTWQERITEEGSSTSHLFETKKGCEWEEAKTTNILSCYFLSILAFLSFCGARIATYQAGIQTMEMENLK